MKTFLCLLVVVYITDSNVESSTFEDYIEKKIEKKLKEYEGQMKYDEILEDEFGFKEYGKSMDKRIAGSQLDALLNGDVSIKAENGNLWSVVDRGYKNNIEALKKVEADTSSLFTFEKVDEDHVFIKSKENGKYLSRINRGIDFIEPAKTQPDVYCKFKVTFLDENVVVFQADTGKYLSRVWRGGINNIEPYKTTIDPYCKFTFEKEGLGALLNGDVSIRAENGNLWSVVDRGYKNNIEALEKAEPDSYSLFTFEKVDEEHVYIKSKENGKYLSRINRGIDFIEPAKTQPDVYCKFKVTFLDENVVVFQADTGKYVSRVWRGGRNNIEPYKTTIDPYCKFTFKKESQLDALLNGDVSIKAENGNLWSVVDRGYKHNIEALKKAEADTSSLFTFEKVDKDHVFIKSKENGKYLSRINRGIDFIESAKTQPDVYCKFKVTFLDENVVVFQADTGKYVSRVWRSGRNNIEPYKTTIDPYCKFTFKKVSS